MSIDISSDKRLVMKRTPSFAATIGICHWLMSAASATDVTVLVKKS